MARQHIKSPPLRAVPARHGLVKEVGYDERDANTESQQMLDIGSLLKKPQTDDKDMQQFCAKVGADRKQLTALLKQRKRESEEAETRRRNEIASMIENALRNPHRPATDEAGIYTGTNIAKNAACKPITSIFAASEGLVTEYKRLDAMSKDMQSEDAEAVVEAWNQELAEAERQLEMGARVALRKVKKVLGAEAEAEAGGECAVDENGDEDMQDVDSEQGLNYNLQNGLRYAERGVKRMVKALASDDDE